MKKHKLHIGIDVDGVLRDFGLQFAKYAKQVRGVDVDTEDFQTWGFPNVRDELGRKVIVDVFANPAAGEYVYQNAPPIENALTGYTFFVNHPGIDVYIVSSQKKGYEIFTDRWLEANGFDKHIQTFYESKKIKAPVQILIDDKPDHIMSFIENKRDAILVNQPYNLDVEFPSSVARVNDLIEAFQYVKQRYGRYL